MIGRLFLVAAAAAGAFLVFRLQRHQAQPPPPAVATQPLPALSEAELRKIRASTQDIDPKVRWAAIELLYRLKDPAVDRMVADILAVDSDSQVRRQVVDMLKQGHEPSNAKNLALALKDGEKEVRIAALLALGELGDSRYAPAIAEMLKDYEPDVRMQALRTMGRLQERRQAEYQALAAKLKAEYERNARSGKPQLKDIRLAQ